MRNDFAILILSHGRPDKLYTLKALEKANYTGKWYIVIDDEDETENEYRKKYGDRVVQFRKAPVIEATDSMDTMNEHRAIVYVRNKSFDIARDLGLTYFLQLDDDVEEICARYPEDGRLKAKSYPCLDGVCEAMIDFLDDSGALTVALAQGGDLIGGLSEGARYGKGLLRKAMNSFFCRVDKPIDYRGTMNEDVVTYTTLGSRGELFLTYTKTMILPKATQSVSGGMTEVYKDNGTYMKSFYAVMSMPSCVDVALLTTSHKRIHHKVWWDRCVPQIVNERYKK